MVNVFIVLLFNLVDLIFSVRKNLANSRLISLNYFLVTFLLLINSGLLRLHLLSMRLLFESNIIIMLTLQLFDGFLIGLLLLLFLGLESLESSSGNQHLFGVLVPLLLD